MSKAPEDDEWNGPEWGTPPRPKASAKVKSPWQRFKDSYLEGALHSGLGAEPIVRSQFKRRGYTAEQINAAERGMVDRFAKDHAEDDEAFADVDTLSPANIGRRAVELVGGLLGGVDPTYVLSPGKSVLQRMGAQGAINAGVDAISQGAEIARGVKDEWNWDQSAFAGAGGVVFQGAGEAAGRARLGRRIARGSKTPDFNRIVDITIHSESRGNDNAVSPVGARGKMQVMPGTARDPGFGIRKSNGTKADDARVGRQYLAVMMDRYNGDMGKVWAAYNWGPGNLDKALKRHGGDWFRHAPKETRNYVAQNTRMLGGDLKDVRPDMAHEIVRGEQKARDYDEWAEQNREMLGSDDDLNAGPYLDEADDNVDVDFDEWSRRNKEEHAGFSEEEISAAQDRDLAGRHAPLLDQIEKDATEADDLLKAGHISPEEYNLRLTDLENRMSGIEADGPDKVVPLPGAADKPVNSPLRYGQQWSRGEDGVRGIADAKANKTAEMLEADRKKVVTEVDDTYWNARKILDQVRRGENTPGLTKQRALEIREDMQRSYDWLRLTGNEEAIKIQKDLLKVWDEVTLHMGGGLSKKSSDKFVGKGQKGSVANEPGTTVGHMTAKQVTAGMKDPVVKDALIKSIEAEDKYNTFVGWGNGPGVPEPKSRNSNAYKAWKKKHDELYEAKERTRIAYEDAMDTGDGVVTDGRGKATHDSAKKFIEEYAPIRDPANDMGGEPVSSAIKPDTGNAKEGNDNVPSSGELREGYVDGKPVLLDSNGKPPKELFRVASVAEIEAAQKAGVLTSREGRVHASGKPLLQHVEPGSENVLIRIEGADGFRPKRNLDGEVFGVADEVPMSRIQIIARGTRAVLEKAVKTLKDIVNDEEGTFRPFGRKKGPEGPDGEGPNASSEAVKKLRQALDDALPKSRAHKAEIAAARRERLAKVAQAQKVTGGEAGFHAELSQLKGAMAKADFDGIRDKLTQDDIDELFDIIKNHKPGTLYDSINARNGLKKLLGEDGRVPTENELRLLGEVFPKDIIQKLNGQIGIGKKLKNIAANVLNLPRSLMSSFDLSAPFRQGLFLIGRKEFYTAFAGMFKVFGSKKAHDALMIEIQSRPSYRLMQRAGLALSDIDGALHEREEAFMSDWAPRIPVLGAGVRASTRAYSGFLNRLRADVFDDILKKSKDAGINFYRDPKALTDIAKYVNAATGRGSLGKRGNAAAPVLSGLLFSPRLMASRITMLNPATYVTLSPVVRKEAIKNLLTFGMIAGTVLGLGSMGGLDVSTDLRSSDGLKMKMGNTRFDVLGGFQQYLKLGVQLATGQKIDAKGKLVELGKGYKTDTRLDVIESFFASKASPVASFVADALRGRDIIGNEFKVDEAVLKRFIPLFMQDVTEAMDEYGAKGVLTAVPAIFGVGVQTYAPRPTKEKQPKADKDEWDWDKTPSPKSEAKDEWDF